MNRRIERILQLDPDVAEMLPRLAGGRHKQSDLINVLVREHAQEHPLAARLRALERELAALKAAIEKEGVDD